MKRYAIFVLFLSLFMMLASCDELESLTIRSVELDESTIPSDFTEGIDVSDIKIIITYENGSTNTMSLNESMVDPEDFLKLTQAGTHQIPVTILGITFNMSITIDETDLSYYQEYLPNVEDVEFIELEDQLETVTTIIVGSDSQSETEGAVYVVGKDNAYGFLKLVVVVDYDMNIQFLYYLMVDDSYQVEDKETNLQLYNGMNLETIVTPEDLIAGVTTTMNTVEELLADVHVTHQAVIE
jgi:hypothetical protein